METLTKIAALALSLGATAGANASSYTFLDSAPTLVTESTSFSRSISYAGLDNTIESAFLTVFLSDDQSSTVLGAVDLPIETAQLTSATGSLGSIGSFSAPLASAEVDGNSTATLGTMHDNIFTVTLGTTSPYFNYDVTSLLDGTSGTLSFTLDALDTISNFPFLLGGGVYTEDFTYKRAELSIETSPVPIPAAIWLMSGSLLGLIRFSRRSANTAT